MPGMPGMLVLLHVLTQHGTSYGSYFKLSVDRKPSASSPLPLRSSFSTYSCSCHNKMDHLGMPEVLSDSFPRLVLFSVSLEHTFGFCGFPKSPALLSVLCKIAIHAFSQLWNKLIQRNHPHPSLSIFHLPPHQKYFLARMPLQSTTTPKYVKLSHLTSTYRIL